MIGSLIVDMTESYIDSLQPCGDLLLDSVLEVEVRIF